MVRPSAVDPPEITFMLWDGFGGGWGGPPLGTGWDIGANCGQSVPTMRRLFSHVISFEPYPESYEYCRVQYPDLDIRNEAVSYQDGEIELALPPGEQTDTGQLVTAGTPDMEWSRKDWSDVPRWKVPCRTVDSLARELGIPDFIKVDTEGHEVRVLDGATTVLDTAKTDWLIEVHSQANFAWCERELHARKYNVRVVRHPHYKEGGKMWKAHGWLQAYAPRSS